MRVRPRRRRAISPGKEPDCGALHSPQFRALDFMILLPAIDLMSGEVVRLRQGKAEEKTVYSQDPAAFARRWEEQGGDYLHLVDLDAAFSGESKNLGVVRSICDAVSIPVELGGGMRSEA